MEQRQTNEVGRGTEDERGDAKSCKRARWCSERWDDERWAERIGVEVGRWMARTHLHACGGLGIATELTAARRFHKTSARKKITGFTSKSGHIYKYASASRDHVHPLKRR